MGFFYTPDSGQGSAISPSGQSTSVSDFFAGTIQNAQNSIVNYLANTPTGQQAQANYAQSRISAVASNPVTWAIVILIALYFGFRGRK